MKFCSGRLFTSVQFIILKGVFFLSKCTHARPFLPKSLWTLSRALCFCPAPFLSPSSFLALSRLFPPLSSLSLFHCVDTTMPPSQWPHHLNVYVSTCMRQCTQILKTFVWTACGGAEEYHADTWWFNLQDYSFLENIKMISAEKEQGNCDWERTTLAVAISSSQIYSVRHAQTLTNESR